MIESDLLDTLVAVVDARGFGRAAERLQVSQPTVSYRIRQLEGLVGAPLFESPRRRVILTEAGRRVYDFGSKYLAELRSLRADLETSRTPLGPLRIACPGAFGRNVVFPALTSPDFEESHIELLFRPLDDIFDLVEAGAVDLGIAYSIRVSNRLEFRAIQKEEFCLVVPAGERDTRFTSLEDVEASTFVAYEECEYVFGKWCSDVFGGPPRRWETELRFSRLEEVLEMVAAGRGCTIAPKHAVVGKPVEERVTLVRPERRPRSFNQEYAVTRPGWLMRPDMQALIDRLAGPERE